MGFEKVVLARLDEEYDVQDVFFSRGTLYVLNAYDVPYVEEFVLVTGMPVKYELASEELAEYAR